MLGSFLKFPDLNDFFDFDEFCGVQDFMEFSDFVNPFLICETFLIPMISWSFEFSVIPHTSRISWIFKFPLIE